jgi:hypothetical protein
MNSPKGFLSLLNWKYLQAFVDVGGVDGGKGGVERVGLKKINTDGRKKGIFSLP